MLDGSDIQNLLFLILGVYSFLKAVQMASMGFLKEFLRNWWEFWDWYNKNRPKPS
jgi:hypothetical protein